MSIYMIWGGKLGIRLCFLIVAAQKVFKQI